MIELLLTTFLWQSANKTQLPPLRVPEGLGCNIHFIVPNEQEVDLLSKGGFKFVRMDFFWHETEKQKGQYDFSGYDQLVAAMSKRGIRILFILDYSNHLYEEGQHVKTEEGRQAFAKWAAEAARRYRGKGILWEIWNEPNIEPFWVPQPSEEHYVPLAITVARAIRQADPGAFILAPATSSVDLRFLEECFKRGLLEVIDAVSVHPYRGAPPETTTREYLRLRALIAWYAPSGKTIPVLSGEWGYSATHIPRDLQGKYLVRQWLSNLANEIPVSIWYDWRDDGPDPKEPEHNFGTVTHDLQPKPAYLAAKTLTSLLEGFEFHTRLHTGREEEWILVFRKGREYVFAAWTTGEARAVELPIGQSKGDLVSHTGEKKSFEGTPEGVVLNLTDAPQYLVLKQVDRRALPELSWRVNPTHLAVRAGQEAWVQVEVETPPGGGLLGTLKLSGAGEDITKSFRLQRGRASFRLPLRINRREGAFYTLTAELKIGTKTLRTRRVLNIALANPLQIRLVPIPPQGIALEIRSSGPGKTLSGRLELEGVKDSVEIKLQGDQASVVRLPLSPSEAGVYRLPVMRLKDSEGRLIAQWSPQRIRILHDFAKHDVTGWQVVLDGDAKIAAEARLSLSDSPAKIYDFWTPSKVAKIEYKFEKGWRFLRLIPPGSLQPIPEVPLEIGLWVYLDGSKNWIRCRVMDSTGQTHQPDDGRAEGTGWRYITMRLPDVWHWGGANDGKLHPPLHWDCPFLLDSVSERLTPSAVYVGPVAAIYRVE